MTQMLERVSVRRLGPGDAASYALLRSRALTEHPEAFRSSVEEETLARDLVARRLASDPRTPHDIVIGAFDEKVLVGVVGMSVDPRVKTRHRGHVFGMHVAAERAGQGLGRALLAALVTHARSCAGVDSLVLTVTDGNAHAQRLYERAGFTTFGVEPGAIRVGGVSHAKRHMLCML